jgi:hypothetical protein
MHRLIIVVIFMLPMIAHAHQPRLVSGSQTQVIEPEVSKAYYGELTGKPHTFIIESPKKFALYANILTPKLPGVEPDVSLVIESNGAEIARLDAETREWESYREEFAGDNYWRGQAYAAQAPAGMYVLTVSSPSNDSRYALAIGEAEVFDGAETMNVLALMPQIKRDFFETSPVTFLFSIVGAVLALVLLGVGALLALCARVGFRYIGSVRGRGSVGGIGAVGRAVRGGLGVGVFAWAVMTSWDPLMLILAGFLIAQALLGWCFFFATKQCAVD